MERVTAAQMAELEGAMQNDFPDSWRDFARSHFVTLLQQGMTPAQGVPLALELARGVGRDLGGLQPYIASGAKVAENNRLDAVVREFNGKNVRALALKHGVGERNIRRMLERDRQRRRDALGGHIDGNRDD